MRRSLAVLMLAAGAAGAAGCGDDGPTSPAGRLRVTEVDRLLIFVRDWPNDYVEIDFKRSGGEYTLVMFRPSQPGVPRVVLDSIGPGAEAPPEIVELLGSFDVWALNAPNAPGAACVTVNGQRSCNITFEDYSLVMQVESGGQVRVQRYTGLGGSTGDPTARALGDYMLAWMRRVEAGTEATPVR